MRFERDVLSVDGQAVGRNPEALDFGVVRFGRKGRRRGRLGVDHRAVAAAEPGLQLDESRLVGMLGLAAYSHLAAHADFFKPEDGKDYPLVQGAHHDDGLDHAGRAERVAVVRLQGGRQQVAQPGTLNGLGLHLVVEHCRSPVRRDAGQGGFPLRREDLPGGAGDTVTAGDGRTDVIGVVGEASVDDVPGIGAGIRLFRQHDRRCALADVEAETLDVERPAGRRRQGLEGLETGQDKRGQGVHAADDGGVVITGSDEPVRQHLRGSARNAGVADRNRIVDKPEMRRHFLRGDVGREVVPVFFGNVRQLFNAGRRGAHDQDRPGGCGVH